MNGEEVERKTDLVDKQFSSTFNNVNYDGTLEVYGYLYDEEEPTCIGSQSFANYIPPVIKEDPKAKIEVSRNEEKTLDYNIEIEDKDNVGKEYYYKVYNSSLNEYVIERNSIESNTIFSSLTNVDYDGYIEVFTLLETGEEKLLDKVTFNYYQKKDPVGTITGTFDEVNNLTYGISIIDKDEVGSNHYYLIYNSTEKAYVKEKENINDLSITDILETVNYDGYIEVYTHLNEDTDPTLLDRYEFNKYVKVNPTGTITGTFDGNTMIYSINIIDKDNMGVEFYYSISNSITNTNEVEKEILTSLTSNGRIENVCYNGTLFLYAIIESEENPILLDSYEINKYVEAEISELIITPGKDNVDVSESINQNTTYDLKLKLELFNDEGLLDTKEYVIETPNEFKNVFENISPSTSLYKLRIFEVENEIYLKEDDFYSSFVGDIPTLDDSLLIEPNFDNNTLTIENKFEQINEEFTYIIKLMNSDKEISKITYNSSIGNTIEFDNMEWIDGYSLIYQYVRIYEGKTILYQEEELTPSMNYMVDDIVVDSLTFDNFDTVNITYHFASTNDLYEIQSVNLIFVSTEDETKNLEKDVELVYSSLSQNLMVETTSLDGFTLSFDVTYKFNSQYERIITYDLSQEYQASRFDANLENYNFRK